MAKKNGSSKEEKDSACFEGEHWVKTYQRMQVVKGKKTLITVQGHCCINPSHFPNMAQKEEMDLDALYFAVTLFAEARGQNALSQKMIVWVIRNRLSSGRFGKSYKEIVTRRAQFSCWFRSDPNYRKILHPGKDGPFEKSAWNKIKVISLEVIYAPISENPIPKVFNYFSGAPNFEKNPWQKNHFDIPGVSQFHFVRGL